MGSTMSIKDRKISDTKKFKFIDANGNEIKEINYLVDYIENSIEKYIEGKHFSVQTRSTKNGRPIYKNYNFSDCTNLWSLVKKNILKKIFNKRSKKTTKCYRKNVYMIGLIWSCIIGLVPLVLEEK